jgi:hypothetical protein
VFDKTNPLQTGGEVTDSRIFRDFRSRRKAFDETKPLRIGGEVTDGETGEETGSISPFFKILIGASAPSGGAANPDNARRWQAAGKPDGADIGTWHRWRSVVHGTDLERRATFVANRIAKYIRTLPLKSSDSGRARVAFPISL